MKCSTWPTRFNALHTAAGRRNNAALSSGSTGKVHCEKTIWDLAFYLVILLRSM